MDRRVGQRAGPSPAVRPFHDEQRRALGVVLDGDPHDELLCHVERPDPL